MTVQFSEDDLLRELGAASVDKGELLWLDDRVRQVEVDGRRNPDLGQRVRLAAATL